MTDPISSVRGTPVSTAPGNVGGAASTDPDATLRQAARQLEGVFVQHLFAAMRETVPSGGLVDGGSGEDIFNSMLDNHLADQLAEDWDRGLGAAVYRQLRAAIMNMETPADAPIQSAIGE